MKRKEFKALTGFAEQLDDGDMQLSIRFRENNSATLLDAGSPQVAAAEQDLKRRISHAEDFSSLSVGENKYPFTPKQRLIVRELWKARRQGHGWVSHDSLLEAAESEGGRVWHIFRNSKAWGTIIVSSNDEDAQGSCYRLKLE